MKRATKEALSFTGIIVLGGLFVGLVRHSLEQIVYDRPQPVVQTAPAETTVVELYDPEFDTTFKLFMINKQTTKETIYVLKKGVADTAESNY